MNLINCTAVKNQLICNSFYEVHQKMINLFPGFVILYKKNGIDFRYSEKVKDIYVVVSAYEVSLFFEIVTIYLI